jgi:hypothetical protein
MPPRSHVDCRISKEARGGRKESESFPDPHSLACASRPDCLQHPLEALGWRLGGSGERNPDDLRGGPPHNGVSESVYDHCDPFRTQRKPTH